ncbi:hypothetical protein QCM80_40690, partial [Bradyrhizobium sp. SSUT112]|nr:hypothetical protein [Bradyrhizobium sp. SSUT112]
APRQSERTKLLRATIIAAIITSPRHRLAILIVARFPSRLSRYSQRSLSARYEKARRGELVVAAPVGFVKAGDRYEKDPDRRV